MSEPLRDVDRERLERIARKAAKAVDAYYEFGVSAESAELAVDQHIGELDDLLIEAGLRQKPHVATEREQLEWIKARVEANGREFSPKLAKRLEELR